MGDKQYIGCNMRREHCYTKIFEQTAFSRELKIFSVATQYNAGNNCVLFGCWLVERAVFRCFAGWNDGEET
jgi:hypothetical protein